MRMPAVQIAVCRITPFCKKASASFLQAVILDGRRKNNTENGEEEMEKGKEGGREGGRKGQEKLWIWICSIFSLCHLS